MRLRELRTEFELAAQAYARADGPPRLFFVELGFERSQPLFERLGVKQLPFIFHWGPAAPLRPGKKIALPKSEQVRAAAAAAAARVFLFAALLAARAWCVSPSLSLSLPQSLTRTRARTHTHTHAQHAHPHTKNNTTTTP